MTAQPIRVVSLFCGIGGSDLGLYAAADELGVEVEVVDAIDSWEPAVRVYNANQRHAVARVADVKKLTRADLPEHDLVIGGPPCQDHSVAGKRACKCNVGGEATARCCLADFVRLADGSPWIMENVVSRLINAPWSEKLCAADFGDVTSRKRWFYSNYLLHVVRTPGSLRIRDIRDYDEDRRVLCKRAGCKAGIHGHYDDTLNTLSAHSWHGHDIRGSGKLVGIVVRTGDTGNDAQELGPGDVMPSLTAKSSNNCNMSAAERLVTERSAKHGIRPVATDDDIFPSLTAHMPNDSAMDARSLKLGLRGNSASASASAFDDGEVLGSVLANSFHGNESSKLVGCRNPSLLEMARAHSIPDSWDWAGATKTQHGQMVANSWPVGMATAVCKAMLLALIREREMVA